MEMKLLGTAQTGKTEVDILTTPLPTSYESGNYSSARAALLETARHLTDSDEDKPTPAWSQGGKVELD